MRKRDASAREADESQFATGETEYGTSEEAHGRKRVRENPKPSRGSWCELPQAWRNQGGVRSMNKRKVSQNILLVTGSQFDPVIVVVSVASTLYSDTGT